ncbi:MAG: RagB/SusD family nutrient uptake outer membrane protein [Candidatus Cryptobacteroides sp.]
MEARKMTMAALACLLTITSCSLKEQVTSYSQREDFYRNVSEIQAGLNACYTPIRSIFSNVNFWQMTECHTDLMYLNVSNQYNAICSISPSRPGCATVVWQNAYSGVSRANTMSNAIDTAAVRGYITGEEALSLKAEAVILRAFHYYVLTATFGDVPYYTEEVTEQNRERISTLPRMSAEDTRDALIGELREYLLPEPMGGRKALELRRTYEDGTDYRIGAAVGLYLGGRMALWNGRWQDAVDFFSVLEDIYGELSKYPLSDVPFSRKFTKESIWEVPQVYEPYGLQITGGIAPWSTPVRRQILVEDEDAPQRDSVHCFYNGIAIPELGYDAHIYSCARPTPFVYQNLLPYNSPDLRTGEYSNGATSARGGSGTLAWRWSGFDPSLEPELWTEDNRSVRWFTTPAKASGCPWLGNKFWCWDMKYARDSNNYKIFRYAGAVLGLAEAHLMLGDRTKSLHYLNMTRRRAGLQDLSTVEVGGKDELLMEEIRCEYARELFGEFQRKFDLVRWGIWYERTTQYNNCSRLLENIRPCHRYWPIPSNQVANSGGALDNKEYGE